MNRVQHKNALFCAEVVEKQKVQHKNALFCAELVV
jgi:hypothetical protein